MDEEKILGKVKRYLEEKEQLSGDECLIVSKILFDNYFSEVLLSDEDDDEGDDEDDDFEEFEESDVVDVKKVNSSNKIPIKKSGVFNVEPAKKVAPVITQEDIDEGNF